MAPDRRLKFLEKWYDRGLEADDPFDRFFSFWISLVVAAPRLRTAQGSSRWERSSDREKVLEYLEANLSRVAPVLERSEEMQTLAQRRGTHFRNAIVDTPNPNLRHNFRRLSDHCGRGPRLDDDDFVAAVGELINRIRNNVFHGAKVYDDREDLELLGMVNPLLRIILEECENLEAPGRL